MDQMIKYLNVRAKIVKVLEENVRINFHEMKRVDGFLDMTAKETKGKKR